jgi:DNA (cytosine-5)-methyltransferase 1
MGSNRVNNVNDIDAATVRLVRLIVVQIKNLERSEQNAEGNRRFVSRIVEAASDGVRERAFQELGFCVVQAGDIKFGQDIRNFKAPSGKFNGVIGGTCCQNFSTLNRNPNREAGIELLNEFCRVVKEAAPQWFLMENVPNVPNIEIEGYTIQRFNLSPRECGPYSQIRNRAFQFGFTEGAYLDIKRERTWHEKVSCVTATEGRRTESRRTFADVCELQGLERTFKIEGFTRTAEYDAVGNAVHLAVGKRIANAIRERSPRGEAKADMLCACSCGRSLEGMRSDAVVGNMTCRKRFNKQKAKGTVNHPLFDRFGKSRLA